MANREKTGLGSFNNASYVADTIAKKLDDLLSVWVKEQWVVIGRQQGKISENHLRQQCKDFLQSFSKAVQSQITNIDSSSWESVRAIIGDISRTRGEQGFTPTETAHFVFSLKRPLFEAIVTKMEDNAAHLAETLLYVSEILDKLGLYSNEVYQKTREDVILRQQQDLLELSTPVVSLAEGILALPVIGTLDSERTQVVMESLLETIVQTGSTIAIIDITGVPTVDTLVAQHLLKTVTAARLMGADCIISGIRPQIAQTIVHLGVELGNVTTKASLAAAFRAALDARGLTIAKISSARTLEKL